MATIDNEIDLKSELELFFNGTDFGHTKYNILIHRKVRYDASGSKINCGTCWNKKEQSGRPGCPDCEGLGLLWDDVLIYGYMFRPQYIRLSDEMKHILPVAIAQNKSMELIAPNIFQFREYDQIHVPNTETTGTIKIPVSVYERYTVAAIQPQRLDHNSVEYNIVVLTKI